MLRWCGRLRGAGGYGDIPPALLCSNVCRTFPTPPAPSLFAHNLSPARGIRPGRRRVYRPWLPLTSNLVAGPYFLVFSNLQSGPAGWGPLSGAPAFFCEICAVRPMRWFVVWRTVFQGPGTYGAVPYTSASPRPLLFCPQRL